MNKKIEAHQARAFKKYNQGAQNAGGINDFMQDISFNRNATRSVQKFERKQRITNIQDQVDYYGYEIEPFHMKGERDIGNFDKGGFFVFNKSKDKTVNDAWLDSLDMDNRFDQSKQSVEVSKKKISQLDNTPDGYEKEKKKRFGNIDIGGGFFRSSRFSSREEALNYYRSLEQDDDAIQEDSNESKSDSEEEIPSSKGDQPKKHKHKPPTEEANHPNLFEFEPEQLKQILVDLLDDDETPNQAMKRLKDSITPIVKKPLFKKNQRKLVKTDQEEHLQHHLSEEQILEAKTTFQMILDLCHTIMTKTEDPDIYTRKRSQILPVDQEVLTTRCPNTGENTPRTLGVNHEQDPEELSNDEARNPMAQSNLVRQEIDDEDDNIF